MIPRGTARVCVGSAGWTIAATVAARLPGEGSHLERYAQTMPGAEINSSFYRAHRRSTYERWAAAVPEEFRFAVKLPRAISHDQRLVATDVLLDVFLAEAAGLGARRGPLLLQLPPSLAFPPDVAAEFLGVLRERFDGDVVCEPRHESWFGLEADALLAAHRVARVAADPAVAPRADTPGGWRGLRYYRLHGSPRVYYSAYGPERLQALATRLRADLSEGARVWCIFDNTASGAALEDALALIALVA